MEMSTVIEAEYIAAENVLKLSAPLEGVQDHALLEVEIKQASVAGADRPWMKVAGSLSAEDGSAIAKAIREGFGRDEIEV